MQLLRLTEVPIGPNDRVFRHAPFRALIVWLAGIAAVPVLFFKAYTEKFLFGYIFGFFALLFVLFTRRFVTARFHPSNWLVRMNEMGIYVQYRSYLNYEFPAEDASVFFLSFGEIASARLIKERLETPDPARGGTQTQFLRHVELELSGNTGALADALNAERGEQAPMKKHWYGVSSSTVYRDYPVVMSAPQFVRIHWNVVPGAHKFLEAVRPYTIIADTVSITQDFSRLKFLGREDQQKRLRELAVRGDVISATYAARQIYGGSLGDAKRMIDSLLQTNAARSASQNS